MNCTPGPWKVDPENDHAVITADGTLQVCETFSGDGPFDGDGAADARLITCAPDLLEALKACMELARLKVYPAAVTYERYNALIAKAEGRT
jgi:hypothetical protein